MSPDRQRDNLYPKPATIRPRRYKNNVAAVRPRHYNAPLTKPRVQNLPKREPPFARTTRGRTPKRSRAFYTPARV